MTRGKKLILVIDPDNYYNGASGAGTTYTRWGKSTCRSGAQLVYSGVIGGGFYTQRGNGASYMCMPKDPVYLSAQAPSAASYIYGAEYETGNRIFGKTTHDYSPPCAVCRAIRRTTTITIPAKPSCPSGWTREYFGYMMSSYYGHAQQVDPVCVDHSPDIVPGSQGNQNGILLYFMRVICRPNSIPCGRYKSNLAITCAVCSR